MSLLLSHNNNNNTCVCRIISSNGFDAALVVDSPAAAAALAAQTEQQQPTDTAAEAVAGVPQGPQAGSDLYVLVARKAKNWTAGAAEADIAAAVDMRPDNVGSWFTKVCVCVAGNVMCVSRHAMVGWLSHTEVHSSVTAQPGQALAQGWYGAQAPESALATLRKMAAQPSFQPHSVE